MTHPRCDSKYCLDGHISITRYEGVIKEVLEFYKRRGVFKLEAHIKEILQTYFFELRETIFDTVPKPLITCVPLFKYDRIFRAYSVAERLADLLAETVECTFNPSILEKRLPTMPQKNLTRAERLSNLAGAFSVIEKDVWSFSNIVLVDDVWTTGATLCECAKTLKKAGVKTVWAVTLCRGST